MNLQEIKKGSDLSYLQCLSSSLVVSKHVAGLHPSDWCYSTWHPKNKETIRLIRKKDDKRTNSLSAFHATHNNLMQLPIKLMYALC